MAADHPTDQMNNSGPNFLLVLVDWVSRTRDKKDSLFHLEARIYLMKGNAEQLWAIHTIYRWEIVGFAC